MEKLTGLARRTRRLARTAAVGYAGRRPLLSIVVPIYDVEPYLAACLESILRQPFGDLEVVLVDDGSTDASGDIARGYARRHPHVRLHQQTNAGLGAARNTGVALARGEYLAFVDSDDELPPDAYTPMVRTLRTTGSDFVIGMAKRDDGRRQFATERMRDNHRAERLGVTLEQMPRILADVFAWNKVFRRSFWDAAGLSFPEGVRYEDQPAITQALVQAKAFDVITDTVYLWRIREDRSSITQRRHDIADLEDRITTKRMSDELLRDAPAHVRRVWWSDVLPVDMWEYFRAVPGCDEDYWTLLRDGVREFWNADTVPFEETLVPVQQRVMGWLVAQDRRADLERFLPFVDAHRDALPPEDELWQRARAGAWDRLREEPPQDK